MEVFFLTALIMLYLLFDAPSACRAFDSRINRFYGPGSFGYGSQEVIYVFARWLPSQKIRMDSPTIYYIPCDGQEIAEKLASTLQRFGTDKGTVIDLSNIHDLEKHVSNHYRLTDFELSRFPIPADKLLEGMN